MIVVRYLQTIYGVQNENLLQARSISNTHLNMVTYGLQFTSDEKVTQVCPVLKKGLENRHNYSLV